VTTAASSQPDTASAGHRPAAAALAAATATTASPRPLPAGSSGTGSTAKMPASRVKNPRTRPAEERNRRSLSRTVSCGTPLAAAIDRNPCPRVLADLQDAHLDDVRGGRGSVALAVGTVISKV